jgi:hypothetical protein
MTSTVIQPIDEQPKKNSKCKGYRRSYGLDGDDFECGYDTVIACEDCKYGPYPSRHSKNPAAKCNQA